MAAVNVVIFAGGKFLENVRQTLITLGCYFRDTSEISIAVYWRCYFRVGGTLGELHNLEKRENFHVYSITLATESQPAGINQLVRLASHSTNTKDLYITRSSQVFISYLTFDWYAEYMSIPKKMLQLKLHRSHHVSLFHYVKFPDFQHGQNLPPLNGKGGGEFPKLIRCVC